LPARRGPLSNVAEACRTIGAAIHFGQSPAACRKLVITSPMSGDGKTTVASNLAAVLAESGSRVLLVDADFRHPTLHRVFGIGNQIGLTSVLRGQGPAAAAIQRTAIEGLDVLPSGPVAGRSWQPLYGRRFDELLEELAGQYDHIILDTPAVTSSSDARVVAAACDAVLLVVRIGKTDPRLAESACDGLLSLGARILGVVINAVSGPAARDISYFENSGALALSDRGSLAKARGRGSVANEAARASGQRG
jgi:capsular exopolysaccharide synthesis family protein